MFGVSVINFSVERGKTWPGATLNCVDPNSGNPVDITGFTPFAEIRRAPQGPQILDLVPSIITLNPGVVSLPAFAKEISARVPAGTYKWGFGLQETATTKRYPFASGLFNFTDGIAHGNPALP